MSKVLFCVLAFRILLTSSVTAQIPGDLTLFKADKITDAQLIEFLKRPEYIALSEEELISAFQKKGMREAELRMLLARLKEFQFNELATKNQLIPDVNPSAHIYKVDASVKDAKPVSSRIFGSELFSNANPLFVPNLKIATPKSYIIGPDDELQLDIYGNNISSQQLIVNPDGMVNVKYAGPINFSGITIEQATGILKSRLLKFYPSLASGSTKLQLTLGSMRSIQVMVIGAVKKPGTITLPSVATLFNALYATGGPADNGSFRNIELVRNNKIIAVADLYDFILAGSRMSNISLHDNDVIRVPFAKIQVSLEGALNRTGIFEVKPNESLYHALEFAGGFLSNAFEGRITGFRFTDTQRKVIDVAKENFATFKLNNGDSLTVNTVVNKFENRVVVMGAVSKPGAYSLESGLDIKGLVAKSQGLEGGAFLARATLVRVNDDLSREFVDVDLKKQLSGQQSISLKKEDSLHIYFVHQLNDKPIVTIDGEVRMAGTYLYEDSLTLQGLMLKAGGFLGNAFTSKIEIGRRKVGVDQAASDAKVSEIIVVELNRDLGKTGADIFLQPYDQVSVRRDPGVAAQKKVLVSGQVLLPGSYTMESSADRLSVLLSRCGGLLPTADIDAVKLIRKGVDKQSADLKSASVAVNLGKAMKNPGSIDDILLEEGDELVVSQVNYIVQISGEVQKPVSVQYHSNLSLQNYINMAGGYGIKAKRRQVFIVYPSGKSRKVNYFLGILRVHPPVTPGSVVVVPMKEERHGNK